MLINYDLRIVFFYADGNRDVISTTSNYYLKIIENHLKYSMKGDVVSIFIRTNNKNVLSEVDDLLKRLGKSNIKLTNSIRALNITYEERELSIPFLMQMIQSNNISDISSNDLSDYYFIIRELQLNSPEISFINSSIEKEFERRASLLSEFDEVDMISNDSIKVKIGFKEKAIVFVTEERLRLLNKIGIKWRNITMDEGVSCGLGSIESERYVMINE